MCTLLIRGPQTLGELRDGCDRMYSFEDLEAVQAMLEHLASHEAGKLVSRLAKSPGQKEARFAQLLAGEPPEVEVAMATHVAAPSADRMAAPQSETTALWSGVAELRRQLEDLQRPSS